MSRTFNTPQEALRHHVTGAIERGESVAIVGQTKPKRITRKDRQRYRAIMNRLAYLRRNGWDESTHPDFEFLEKEVTELGERMIAESMGD